MSENVETTMELKQNQIEYLDNMVQKHQLPDRGKALRCLITFAMEKAELEESIFEEIRCMNC